MTGQATTFSSDQLADRYSRDGYLCPIPVIPAAEMAALRANLASYLERSGRDTKDDPYLQFKVHMVFGWADRLIRHPAMLDAVEALIGPDILVWNTAVLIKPPQKRDFVSWHQDVYYWGNHPDHVVGAWLAITDSTPENGCVRVIPGSHEGGILPHRDTFGADNMLSRGQQIDAPPGEDRAVDMVLRAGEMSLHHTRMIHGSRPNRSNGPRMGFVITYMTPATRMTGPRTGAMLVRGVDRYGHFEPENVRPAVDFDPAGLAAHDEAMRPFSQAIYQGAETSERQAKTTDATR